MTHLKSPIGRLALSVAAAAAAWGASATVQAETVIGLTTTNALVSFDSGMPTWSGMAVNINGLMGVNERILGIDLRPATGMLYGLSSDARLYTLNSMTGAATFVASLAADPADLTSPFSGLMGSSYGVDFNPVVDRLRITSNAGQNLRVNVATGNTTTDAMLNGAASGIAAAAYSNNDNNPATGTTLYGIDGATDRLYIQSPPNNGTLVAVGSLGMNTSNVAGFDISGATGMAYAALTDGDTSKSGFYTINLTTGAATLVGELGYGGNTAIAPPLLDITVAAVPEPASYALMLGGLLAVGGLARRRKAST